MRTFVISLKDDYLKRRDNIIKQLNAYNLDFEFVDAITEDYVKENRNDLYNNLAIYKYNRDMSNSEIACALSHIKVYLLMLKQDLEAAIILEDDVIPNSCLTSGIEFITSKIRVGTLERGIRIGVSLYSETGEFTNPIRPSIFKDFEIIQKSSSGIWGAFAYVITKDQAKEISEKNFPVQFVADHPLRDLPFISPTLFDHDFNLETTMSDRSSFILIRRRRKFYLIFFRTFERIWKKITNSIALKRSRKNYPFL